MTPNMIVRIISIKASLLFNKICPFISNYIYRIIKNYHPTFLMISFYYNENQIQQKLGYKYPIEYRKLAAL